MNYADVQKEHAVWLDERFPDQPPALPAAGMVEEAGELLHVALAMEREKLWGPDKRYPNLVGDMVDAVGDCALYVCSFCNSVDKDFALAMGWPRALIYDRPILSIAVSLVDAACSFSASSLDPLHLAAYIGHLKAVCAASSLSLEDAVSITWARVRDRKPKPRTVCLCGSTRFKEEFVRANFEETVAGRMVLTVGWFSHADSAVHTPTVEEKLALDELHKRKIDAADEVRVVAPLCDLCRGCGKPSPTVVDSEDGVYSTCCGKLTDRGQYIGDSTRSEIDYAVAQGKGVRYGQQ